MQTINIKHLKLGATDWVLDLGCGEGRHTHAVALTTANNVVAIDISHKDVNAARCKLAPFANQTQRAQCHWTIGSGLHLPFTTHQFDVVICSEVLEHIEDYQTMLCETKRVLKPGGTFAVSVPRQWPEAICWWLSEAYYHVPGGHIRIFNARQLQNTITRMGFKLIKKHWAHALHAPYWWLRCALWQHGEGAWPVRYYHKLLVWDLLKRPALTRFLEWLLNPVLGKSVVLYFHAVPALLNHPQIKAPKCKP